MNEICHDIKKLDYAKTHLQASITSLKRLQMLITAVGQLEVSTVRAVLSSFALSGIYLFFSIVITILPIVFLICVFRNVTSMLICSFSLSFILIYYL